MLTEKPVLPFCQFFGLVPTKNNIYLCVCVCYWAPVRVVCPNHEVVELQPWTVTPPKPRLRRLLLHSYP